MAIADTGVLAGAPWATGSQDAQDAGAVYYFEGLTPLFLDGSESGDTLAWSSAVP